MSDAIEDNDNVLRRIPNGPPQIKVYDSNESRWRLSSAWFTDRNTEDAEVSVTLETPMLNDGLPIDHALYLDNPKHDGFGLARCNVGFLREELEPRQTVEVQPTDEDPYHGLVKGAKSKSLRNKVAKHAEILIDPRIGDRDQ